jgi:translation initiation factor eIF-2B subunit alpha
MSTEEVQPPAVESVIAIASVELTLDCTDEEQSLVLADLRENLSQPLDSLFNKSSMAVPVAAIRALLGVVQRSTSETMMGLQDELKRAADTMLANFYLTSRRCHIALQSGCELFLKYITRTFLESPDFLECRKLVLERGFHYQMLSLAARDRIAHQAAEFVPNNSTVLTHGWSRVVAAILLEASKTKHFDLIILEGRPDASGAKAARSYAQETTIPVTLVTDSSMAYYMESVDIVLVGAEGVLENGGVVNKIGTYAVATCANAAGKPVYVAAESYKFARLYPLSQSDLPSERKSSGPQIDFYSTVKRMNMEGDSEDIEALKIELPANVKVKNPSVDFTPAKFITLLFTDLGVLTPSAVSDELIRLYQ